MSSYPTKREISRENLLQFNLYRLTIISVFFAFAIFLTNYFPKPSFDYIKIIIEYVIVSYFITILVVILLSRLNSRVTLFAHIQFFLDMLITEYLIYGTGSNNSPFTFLLLILILSVSYFSPYWINIFYAIFSGIIYILLLYLRNYQMGSVISPPMLIKIFYLFSSMLIFALLGSYIYEKFSKVEDKYIDKSKKLVELENLYKTVINKVSAGIIIVGSDFKIFFENSASKKITNGTLINKNILDIIPNFKFETVYRKELLITINKNNKFIGYSSTRVQIGEEEHLLLVFQDLTEVKNMEERIIEKEKMATIGEIVMNISHDLRNPLSSIKGSTELIAEEIRNKGIDNKKILKLINIVSRESDRVDNLLSSLLNFAKSLKIKKTEFILNQLITEIFEQIKNMKEFSNNKIKLILSNKEILFCGDKFWIGEVFSNLIKNSFEAIDKTTGEINIVITSNKDFIFIKIKDSGDGINEQDAENIFKPFFTNKRTGTGLGLSIVKKIILEHNGKISWLPQEKLFLISLPLEKC